MSKAKIDLQSLSLEYMTWSVTYGPNENLEDFTFADRLYGKFDMSDVMDISKERDTEATYVNLLKELYERQEAEG